MMINKESRGFISNLGKRGQAILDTKSTGQSVKSEPPQRSYADGFSI